MASSQVENTNKGPLLEPKNIIIGALLVVTVGLILFMNPQPQVDSQVWKNEINRLNERDKIQKEEKAKLLAKIKSDSLDRINERQAYQAKDKAQSIVISDLKKNPQVVTILKDNPIVAQLITELEKRDSLKTERIITLEKNLSELQVDVSKLQIGFNEQMKLQAEKYTALENQTVATEKELRKHRRSAKIFKAVAITGTVLGLLAGSRF